VHVPSGLVHVLSRQNQQTLRCGVVLSPSDVDVAVTLGADGDTLLRRVGAGASRLPKTLGAARTEAPPTASEVDASGRDAVTTGCSILPVAGLNVASTLVSGAPSLRTECLWNRFCSARFAKRWCRGSLSLILRIFGSGLGLKLIDTLPVDFRFRESVGRIGTLLGAVAFPESNEAVESALLRADELGAGRSVAVTCAEDEEATLLRADDGFFAAGAFLVVLLAAPRIAMPVSLLSRPVAVGCAVVLEDIPFDAEGPSFAEFL
jgi:hypothetical protein